MILKVLGSSSTGNCYLLQSNNETLIIECGIRFSEVKKSLNFNLSSVVGCIISHEHKDHCKEIRNVINCGVDVYLSRGTAGEIKVQGHRVHTVKPFESFKVGGYTILPFDTKHDCKEPLGFLIRHEEMGTMLFATDTYYIEYQFSGLNHILVECNYAADMLDDNLKNSSIHLGLRSRVMKSHFELDNVKAFLSSNDLSSVRSIVLLHLSESNGDKFRFLKEISETTKKNTFVAEGGFEIDLSFYPF